ncbi:MAG: magnesium transporter CorA family protein [Anaerotignaceae bacterium]
MVYEITNEIKEIKIENINPQIITVGHITLEELKEYNHIFGFSEFAISECSNASENFRNSIDVYDDYSFGIINIIDVGNILSPRDRIGFFIKHNLFLLIDVIDYDKSTLKLFEFGVHRIKPSMVTLEKIIYSILEGFLYNDNKALEEIEIKLSNLEEEIISCSTDKKFTADMLFMKKTLLILHNYYEQLIDIGEELQENRNDVFGENHLRSFKLFTSKATRLSGNVQRLRENVVQLSQAHQANMDYNLNSIMKMFTVVTTIFLPLTLIAGWYGMNFQNMPELSWEYGYTSVCIFSILVIAFCIWLFKRKKLL